MVVDINVTFTVNVFMYRLASIFDGFKKGNIVSDKECDRIRDERLYNINK